MNQNPLFNRTRLKLATWYVGVMGAILSLSGLAFHHALAQDQWRSLDRELESLTGTLHDGLEPMLKQPGRIESTVQQLLPGLCITASNCSEPIVVHRVHVLGSIQQGRYYVQFLSLSQQLLATVGEQPQGLKLEQQTTRWQIVQDLDGTRYHQLALLLKTADGRPWGYLKVGQSLKDHDQFLASLKLCLLIGLPIALLLVGVASWWLAGLAMRPVYHSYQQIQQFTIDAAHELRTPIAAIQATVEARLGAEDLPSPETHGTLQAIDRQNHRLSQLVQDLLLLSRMDLQALPIKNQLCNLQDLIGDLLEELAALALAADLLLVLDLQTHSPLDVAGDADPLYRLLANLITNAIQYTPAGGKVTVSLGQEERVALIQVQDTGIGIAPEDQSRIFDRFYRVGGDRSRKTGGAGLGLPIAQAIAQAHNGSIQVQSAVGKGSVFTVRLPFQ